MKISKCDRRSYKPYSAPATARRQSAGQYNWAIHQIIGGLSSTTAAMEIAQKLNDQNLIEDCLCANQTIRNVLDRLRNPDTRKAWMDQTKVN